MHQTRQRLTWGGGYRSPIFQPGDDHILVLNGDTLVRLSAYGGESEALRTLHGALKLVGFSQDDQDKVLLLSEDAHGRLVVGLLSLQSGHVTSLPYDKSSPQDRGMLSHLKGWDRMYDHTTVYVESAAKQTMAGRVRWTEVYIKPGNQEPVNLSKCDGTPCGQPSLSHDHSRVVFIKATGL
jgi:hypothetical protein